VRYELEVEIKTKMQSVSLPKYLGKAGYIFGQYIFEGVLIRVHSGFRYD